MTAQQLRNSILQQAIQGRLVPQDPNDEPARVLLEKIREQKEQLVKEGKLKKKDLVVTPIADDERPFDLPSGWEWCRLGECLDVRDGTHDTPKYVENGIPLVTSKNLKDGRIDLENVKFISKEDSININLRSHVDDNDILFAMIGSIGNPVLVKKEYEFSIKNMALFKHVCKSTYMPYVWHALNFLQNDMRAYASGAVQSFVSLSYLRNYPFPLPPLAEQRRIVAKIEELMPLVEKYGKAQSELDNLNASLPSRLRQSILQKAIQGRLVPQDPNDEPASVLLEKIRKQKEQLVKEGKLKKKDLATTPIADDEKPFDLPSGWEWCNLGNILSIVTGKKDANQGCENGPYPFFTCSMTPIRSTTYSFEGEAILLPGNGANVGMSILYDGKFEVYQRTYVLQSLCDNYLFLPYIKLALDWNWKQYNDDKLYGSAIPYIKLSNLQNYIFPLPPLAEQRRIVAKIEELFAEIDKLK